MTKETEYTAKLLSAIQGCFDEDSENYIDKSELTEDNNMTHFIQALANMTPTHIYNVLTGDDLNTLDFNHVANKLVFKYSTKES